MKNNKNFIRTFSVYTLVYLLFFLATPLPKVLAQVNTDSLIATYPEYIVFGTPVSEEEEKAMWAVMERFGQGWSRGDAKMVASCFAADAEWINAFGNTERGRESIHKYHQWLFKEFNLGKATASTEKNDTGENDVFSGKSISTRYLGDDVAVLHGLTLTTMGNDSGQGMRKIHVTSVVAKQDDIWEIVHQMVMDERE